MMKQAARRIAAIALACSAGAALAHGDAATHVHDTLSSTLAGSLVGALFAGAALRGGWLAVAALRRRAGLRRSGL